MKKQANDYIEYWKSVILRWVLKRHASMRQFMNDKELFLI